MAELSYDEESSDLYRVTEQALQYQSLANRLFDPEFARYRPAVVANAEVIFDERGSPDVGSMSELIHHSNRRFNQALSSIQLESQETDDLRAIV